MQCIVDYHSRHTPFFSFFFFNDTATTEIYTLSLHDALPIYTCAGGCPANVNSNLSVVWGVQGAGLIFRDIFNAVETPRPRSEEHTSELQSRSDLVCRLLLEKKKKNEGSLAVADKCLPRHTVC